MSDTIERREPDANRNPYRTRTPDPLIGELAAMLETALGVIDKSKIIWMGEDNARALLSRVRGER